jgi:hypothetical protein
MRPRRLPAGAPLDGGERMSTQPIQTPSDQGVSVNKRIRAFPSTQSGAASELHKGLLTENRRSRVVSWLKGEPIETGPAAEARADRMTARQRSNQALHTCPGYNAFKEHLDQGGKLTYGWSPSKIRSCELCLKWLVQREVDRILHAIGNTAVVASTIDASAWRRRKDKLDYAKAEHLQVKQPDGQVLVIATAGPGETPADLEGLLTSALMVRPEGTRVTASQTWRKKIAAAAQVQSDEKKVKVIGITVMTTAAITTVVKSLDLYVGPLPGEYETHQIKAINSRLVLAVGMRRVDGGPLKRWRDAA